MRTAPRLLLGTAAAAGLALAASGCSSAAPASPGASSSSAAIGAVDLSADCPATVVVQTDWNPSSEHGHLYELLGPDPVIDSSGKSVSGPLYSGGEYTGVQLEIRAGGPAIGFQTVSSQMYADPSITLGYVQTDGQIIASAEQPTVSVMAPLEVSPQIIMWDPATYPDATTIADIGKTDAVVRYYGGAPYMEYLIQSGLIAAENADGGYDGTPAAFIASGGKDAQQGFASSEPYLYENEIEAWDKPVAYQLVADAGYPNYTATMSVRADALDELDGCLAKLVPVMQQAEVDFYADPEPVIDLILEAVEAYDTGIVYTRGAAEFGVSSALADGLVSNGDDGAIGDFDPERVQRMLDIVGPIALAAGSAPAEGLTAEQLYTNDYIDPSIGLPAD
ncbi:ABC transporter substrate-binding protein [Herbiconiux moechotypicola]|uniref:Nitrate ABC transporter substrate-binding protein n=1 Tax=Herbiconiux moechotypicola TaxID=637393 RepID=A0ABN3DFA4_9MICO|nr:ABC transporter substrate-binding protein [Herbiconiux moechotypicola]MCS5729399.1 ABC transporter substrate-binding protein [Herbiconiux moechotypicola]